ncbi:MAG: LptF/LptG family permease [Candidatus Wallbacteria bacterium]|nr:LptF/LptG family permease [Candidatus Wallbacteria bacterium]
MKILDKYIIWELIGPFIFGICGYVVIMSVDPLIDVIQYIFIRQVDPWIVMKWYFFRVFSGNMIYSFSMASLLATFLVFGRLGKDNEISAALAGGISFLRLLVPVIGFGLIVTCSAMLFINYIAPYTNVTFQKLEDENILMMPEERAKHENILERVSGNEFLYAENLNTDYRRIYNCVLFRIENGKVISSMNAQFADFSGTEWHFFNGHKVTFKNREIERVEKFYQETVKLKLDFAKLAKLGVENEKKFSNMTLSEIRRQIRDLTRRGAVNIYEHMVELYLKLALPFAALIFALAGAALGAYFKRSGLMVGLGLSIVIIFFYYVVLSVTRSYGLSGRMNPFMAAWSANLIFAAIAVYFVKRADL